MIINDKPSIPYGWDQVTFAENQPEYLSLPAAVSPCDTKIVMTEWIPSVEDLEKILSGGKIRAKQLTFNNPLQPLRVEVID